MDRGTWIEGTWTEGLWTGSGPGLNSETGLELDPASYGPPRRLALPASESGGPGREYESRPRPGHPPSRKHSPAGLPDRASKAGGDISSGSNISAGEQALSHRQCVSRSRAAEFRAEPFRAEPLAFRAEPFRAESFLA